MRGLAISGSMTDSQQGRETARLRLLMISSDCFRNKKESAAQGEPAGDIGKKKNHMENPTLYIAYGSNSNLQQMRHRCPTAKPIGNATLEGYQLLFRGGRRGAVVTVEKKKGSSVPALLWKITPTDEAVLDRYEGFPYLYRKETVKVRFGAKLQKVMVYIHKRRTSTWPTKPVLSLRNQAGFAVGYR
jgi:hypothetical protein